MLGLSANTAVGQPVECSDPGVPNGTLELVTFAAGAHVVESGAGLEEDGSGTASVDVPAGATIEDAYVYWAVRQKDGEPDGAIDLAVNGGTTQTVEGDCIGLDTDGDEGPSGTLYAFKYAFPIAGLNAGATNTVDVEVLDADINRADGFSVVVVYSTDASIGHSEFYEGADFIWDEIDVSSSLTIEGSILGQCAGNDLTLHLKVGDVSDDRPHRLTIDIDGTTFLEEYGFFGDQGWEPQWSDREVVIGDADYDAGSEIEVELASEEDPANLGGDPSSLSWIVGGVTCSQSTEVAGCTRTPGYWRNQGFRSGVLTTALASAKIQFPDAFDGDPWDDISVNDARGILNQNSCSDISYCLEKHLLAAILNVANGATNTIADTIDDAIDFLDSDISVDAEVLKDTLDSFNNGLEGPPSCDTLEDEGNVSPSALNRGQIKHNVGPNPFNPSTLIHFELGESMAVRLAVYDVLGREVRILLDETVNAGEHRVTFDANGLPTGTYFYRFVTPEGIFGGQMILMK